MSSAEKDLLFSEVDRQNEVAALKARVAELERLLKEKVVTESTTTNLNADKVWQRESDEKIRFALEASGIGTWEWNILKNEVKWSRNTSSVLGLLPGTFKGTYEGLLEIIHALDQQKVQQAIQNAIDDLGNFEVEFRVVRPDDSIRWYAGKGKVISQETGQAARLLGVIYDIHDLKHAMESLGFLVEASHTLTASLDYHITLQQLATLAVPKLADWCMVFVKESSGELQQLSVNHADPARIDWALNFQKDYPYDENRGRELQKEVLRVFQTGEPQYLPEMNDEYFVSIAVDEVHLRFMREMGPRSKIAVPLVARNRTLGVISFITSFESGRNYGPADLEMVQELARQAGQAVDNAWLYRQAQEAIQSQRELDHLKDQFLSIASHELRTPLTTIKGYSQILQRDIARRLAANPEQPGANNSREIRILANMVSQVDRMETLVSEMLDVSRIQSGQFVLKCSPGIDLAEVVRRVIEQQQDAASDRPLSFQPPDEKLVGSWDEGRLEQVLNNLINNALKYSPAGEPVEIGLHPSENSDAVVWVRDKGMGISSEHQARIFDRFYRARTPMNVNVDGLGLGLYISHETISRHGGKMWLESELGKGSTFYFSLPLEAATGGTEVASYPIE